MRFLASRPLSRWGVWHEKRGGAPKVQAQRLVSLFQTGKGSEYRVSPVSHPHGRRDGHSDLHREVTWESLVTTGNGDRAR